MSSSTLAPFACQYSPNFAELLQSLNCSIVFSTFQAGKVVFISAKDENNLIQLPRTFHTPMGIAVEGDKMAIATKSEVLVTKNSPELAQTYPKQPQTYDAYYLPMATYYTGHVDLHDIHYGNRELWAVNTAFSCLCTIDDDYSFTPQWQPSFISSLTSEDKCHLNGMALENGTPKFISALGQGDTYQSWRDNITKGGVIIDFDSREVMSKGLPMPHSPRIYNGKLYTLLSAAQKLVEVDLQSGQITDVAHIPGFVRGMARKDDFLFISTSKLRKNSSTFAQLNIEESANHATISVIHLPTGSIVAQLKYLQSVDEIYDIQIIEDVRRPNLANTDKGIHSEGLITPQATYWSANSTDA